MSREGLLRDYPNLESNELPLLIGCLPEQKIDDAKNVFLRSCYKDVTIHDVVPVKRNCQPSCAWRVFYKMKDGTPDFVETGRSGEDLIPLPDGEELQTLFNRITAMVVGRSVGYTYDKVYAVVDYVPSRCVCPVQDFSVTAEVPRVPSSITDVSMNFYNMRL